MKLISYEVTNWGPHQRQTLIFPKEAKTIAICGENDQGKSWILRGIAFTLSIGRNEYGDQSSIHIGEKEASHKLTIEHNDTEYTIEKIVKGKSSEEEGTSTWVNGEKKDRSGLEEFYHSTLGLPHPNVWIPICISMQNQTDFHLRGKKRDREEALRLACQLTKIDAWKESLGSLIRGEEKLLTESTAALKAKIEMVGSQIKDITETDSKYKEALKSLEGHKKISEEQTKPSEKTLTPQEREEFWRDIQKNSELVKDWIKDSNRKELEKTNLQKETSLLTNICLRTEKELLGTLPNEIEERKLRLNLIFLEKKLRTLKLNEAKTKASECISRLTEVEKKCEELEEKIPKGELDNQQEVLAKSYRNLSEIENNIEKIDRLNETHNLNLPSIKSRTLDKYVKISEKFKRLVQTSLEDNIEVYQEALKGLTKISSNKPQNSTDDEISTKDYYKWKLLNTKEYSNGELMECPLCDTSIIAQSLITERPKGNNQIIIRELANSLKEEISIKIGDNENYKDAYKLREELQDSLTAFHSLSGYLNNLKAVIENIQKQSNEANLLEDLTLGELIAIARGKVEKTQSTIKTKESLAWTKRELEHLKRERTQLEKNIEDMVREENLSETSSNSIYSGLTNKEKTSECDRTQDPQLNSEIYSNFENYSQEDVLKEVSINRTKLREIAELREKNSKKSKELDQSKARLSLLEKDLVTKVNEITSIQNCLENFKELPVPLPIPKEIEEAGGIDLINNQTRWQSITNCWEERLAKYQKIRALFEDLPQKKRALKSQQLSFLESLEKEEKKSDKILKAKQVMDFLDYKKAPRILLEQIVDQLFNVTNKLAEALSIDTNLIRGKNLEFLTRQTRHSKILEQKTERLGFGKGAMLGICFRLACQRLLLPETGFLLLDEPTANVDNKRKSALKTFIQALSETSDSKNNQIILIEHDQDVVELCQSKLEISNTNKIETT
jgi:DNA repair exonuclease SbcCD ATPase subunit